MLIECRIEDFGQSISNDNNNKISSTIYVVDPLSYHLNVDRKLFNFLEIWY